MHFPRLAIAGSLLLAAAVVVVALSTGARADGATPHRIVFLFVSGSGPQAKAWYDGGAPQGVLVQAALDKFAAEGFRYAGLSSSGIGNMVNVGATSPLTNPAEPVLRADYVILLER
jgi:hypothetical protein